MYLRLRHAQHAGAIRVLFGLAYPWNGASSALHSASTHLLTVVCTVDDALDVEDIPFHAHLCPQVRFFHRGFYNC